MVNHHQTTIWEKRLVLFPSIEHAKSKFFLNFLPKELEKSVNQLASQAPKCGWGVVLKESLSAVSPFHSTRLVGGCRIFNQSKVVTKSLIPRSRLEPPNKLTTVFLPWFRKYFMVRSGQVFGVPKRPFRMLKMVSKSFKHQEMFGRPDGKS